MAGLVIVPFSVCCWKKHRLWNRWPCSIWCTQSTVCFRTRRRLPDSCLSWRRTNGYSSSWRNLRIIWNLCHSHTSVRWKLNRSILWANIPNSAMPCNLLSGAQLNLTGKHLVNLQPLSTTILICGWGISGWNQSNYLEKIILPRSLMKLFSYTFSFSFTSKSPSWNYRKWKLQRKCFIDILLKNW